MIFISFKSAYAIFLLVIICNFGPVFYRFRDTATYSLKLFIENCGQTAADGDMVTIYSSSRHCPIGWYRRRPPITYRLATIPHNWHTIVRYDSSRSSKVNDFRVI